MQSIRSSGARDSLRKSARMLHATSSLSRAILEPEFPEEEERIKKGESIFRLLDCCTDDLDSQ